MNMNNKLFLMATLVICMASCKKDNLTNAVTLPLPTASFSVVGDTLNNVITMGTYDQYQLINNSTNADSYSWNFGNDSTSNRETPVLSYPKSGNYVVTLTAQNATGQKSTIIKNVKVLNRVIRQVVIKGLTNFNSSSLQTLNNPNVWAVIKLGGNNVIYPQPVGQNSSFNAPIVYQSPVQNIGSANLPFTFNVTNKIVLDFPALATLIEKGLAGYKGIGYGLELYAQDNSGTYLLSSSYQYLYSSQSGSIIWPVADIEKNVFIARYGNIDLICDYE
jgi:PKD repeat protein